MITVNNTVPVESNEDWKLHRVTLHISPDVTDRIVWKMLIWERNGFDTRIIDVFAVYDIINGEEGPLTGVTVSLNLEHPHIVNSKLGARQGGFIEIMTEGNHSHLMMVLGINTIGNHSVKLRELRSRNKINFYTGILEHLADMNLLNLNVIDIARHEALMMEVERTKIQPA
ncbi:hypothetical protein CTheo_7778 [Ceratobasidium theobromae]|uniref:Uncharacterized protein n=1 Tax=Ceratobasidium theobromae TaxID=1582974 RepID=A0A5N5QBI3_9AGAM|nr:hypothetical protein CTheo_7778 [Ceratobasidium theobromae]